jgi:hypothetical protein
MCYLLCNVCNDGIKMKTRSANANGMLKYRIWESLPYSLVQNFRELVSHALETLCQVYTKRYTRTQSSVFTIYRASKDCWHNGIIPLMLLETFTNNISFCGIRPASLLFDSTFLNVCRYKNSKTVCEKLVSPTLLKHVYLRYLTTLFQPQKNVASNVKWR